MAKPSFVGFQEQIEIPDGFELLEIHEIIAGGKDRDALFSLLSQANFVSEWFYQVIDFNLKTGGKVKFLNDEGSEFQAICTAIDFGKEVSFLADIFGDLNARITKSEDSYVIDIRFKILTNEVDAKRERIQSSLLKLRELVQ